jgi:hypothetical protein
LVPVVVLVQQDVSLLPQVAEVHPRFVA